MQLLLILSAMVSALTGVFGSARPGVVVQATSVAAVAEAAVAVTTRALASSMPAQPAARAPLRIVGVKLALEPAAPLYALRRRE
jgi:hypothetical protein